MAAKIKALRTPDERFAGLPGYSFKPNYLYDLPGFSGLRLHYLDEGPANAQQVFLCLHGQPTWSYLYRKMIPIFTAAGHRVVAPDFFGFGRSDKPAEDAVYTFTFHRNTLLRLVERLDLKNVTLVCQDWGGILGLTLPMEPTMQGRFARLLVMNTALGTGDVPLTEGFKAWRAFNNSKPDMDIAGLMKRSCGHLSPAECQAYAAPYPDVTYKGGVRRFPQLVPENPNDEGAALGRQARTWWATKWSGASFMAVGAQDPVLGVHVMKHLRKEIKGCPEPLILQNAGHFVQEWGDEVARQALAHFAAAGKQQSKL